MALRLPSDASSRNAHPGSSSRTMRRKEAIMKKLLVLTGLTFGLTVLTFGLAGIIAPVYAVPGVVCGEDCNVSLTINNLDPIDLSEFIVQDPTTGLFGFPVTRVPDNLLGGLATNVTVGATINPDPFIIFALAGTNLTAAPLFFGLHIDTPIALDGTIDASSSIAYTLTDGGTAPSGSVTLTASPNATVAVFTDLFPLTNKGVDIGPTVTATAVANPPCTALVGNTANCGPFATANTFVLPAPATIMNADLGLFISAFDAFSLSGRVDQNESVVPEPASLLLIGTGLLGLAAWRRYSSRG
jgi:hypothetical protein